MRQTREKKKERPLWNQSCGGKFHLWRRLGKEIFFRRFRRAFWSFLDLFSRHLLGECLAAGGIPALMGEFPSEENRAGVAPEGISCRKERDSRDKRRRRTLNTEFRYKRLKEKPSIPVLMESFPCFPFQRTSVASPRSIPVCQLSRVFVLKWERH